MSQATVKTHLTRIYAKVGVRPRTQLAVVLGGPIKTFG
jgi:DNA-binding NarL/FixJ family response regulator